MTGYRKPFPLWRRLAACFGNLIRGDEMVDENGEELLPDTVDDGKATPPEEPGTEQSAEKAEEPSATDTSEEADDTDAMKDEEDEEDEEGEEDGEDGEERGAEGAAALPLASIVEAVLFAAREPLKLRNIARAAGGRTRQESVREAIDELNVHYLDSGRAFEIAEISGRYQLMSRPEYIDHIVRIFPKKEMAEKEKASRLTPSALDALSIIAYKQPVTRADVERVRGCGCGPVLRALIERGSVKVVGKRMDLTGQPLLYGTTEAFLAEFGLGSIEELPMRSDILSFLGDSPAAALGDGDGRVLELLPIEDSAGEPADADGDGDGEDGAGSDGGENGGEEEEDVDRGNDDDGESGDASVG